MVRVIRHENDAQEWGRVVRGLLTILVLSIGTDVLLEKNGYLTTAAFSRNAAWVIALVLSAGAFISSLVVFLLQS